MLKARLFAGVVIATGALVLLHAALHSVWTDPLQFGVYLGLTLIASRMRITLPQTDGNGALSAHFVFILLAVVQLSPAEALAAGCLSVLAQNLPSRRGALKPVRLAFTAATGAIAILLAGFAYRELLLWHTGLGMALAGATALYFLADTWPTAGLIALRKNEPVPQFWFRTFYWYLPFYLVGAVLVAGIYYVALHHGWATSLLVLPGAWALYTAYSNHLQRLEEQRTHIEQISEVHLRTIETLALAIEAKDQNTHDHLCRVRVYACEIGKEMGLNEKELEALRAAALLHDIGKLAIPEHIINKPGKLTPEEFDKMKIHPVVGAEILHRVNFPYPVVPIVRSHHERWDGQGYPDGLAGESIPLGARILTAVDCLDALATDRPYRRALSLEDAMMHVCSLAGSQLDPKVVDILQRRCEELEAAAHREKAEIAPLHLDIEVKRGEQPGAGFELSSGSRTAAPATLAPEHDEPEILAELSQTLERSLALEENLSRFSDGLRRLIPFDTLAVYMRQKNTLLPKFVRGQERALFASLEIPLGEGLSGWVAQNRRPIVNGNPTVEPGYLNDPAKVTHLGSALAVPLENSQGEILGVFALYASAKEAFTHAHLGTMRTMGPKLATAIEDAIRYHLAETQASTDFLTRALNMKGFLARLEAELKQCATKEEPLTLVICDLDGFRAVNQRLGHAEGNQLLAQVAERFRKAIREGDVLGRLGGDEFAVLLRGVNARTAEVRVRDLRAAVRQSALDLFGDKHLQTATFSMAHYPETALSAEELLSVADRALKAAKRTRSLRMDREAPIALAAAAQA